MNLYGFVGNDGVGRIDIFGQKPWEADSWELAKEAREAFDANKNKPKYPDGFALSQRDIREDGKCDCVAIFANAIGGAHSYVQHVGKEGKWGYGFAGSTGPEQHFNPDSSTPCSRTDNKLQYGSGAGKSGKDSTDNEIKDCIENYPPSAPYKSWGDDRYNCRDWAEEASSGCGLSCN